MGYRKSGNGNGGRNGNGNNVETVFLPTENIVNTTTNRRTIRRVHPTHIENVNRNITRIENFFPVTESDVDENIVEEFDCGRDLDRPRSNNLPYPSFWKVLFNIVRFSS